jgi:hypothetical protein
MTNSFLVYIQQDLQDIFSTVRRGGYFIHRTAWRIPIMHKNHAILHMMVPRFAPPTPRGVTGCTVKPALSDNVWAEVVYLALNRD